MSDMWTAKTTGTNKVLAKLRKLRAAPRVLAQVKTKGTTGTYRRKRGPDKIERRGSGLNVIIMRYQAKKGRDLLNLSAATIAKINRMWVGATNLFTINGDPHHIEHGAHLVAETIVEAIVNLVKSGRGMTPVKPSTQRRKDREGTKRGNPALVNTGQLLRSLIAAVRRW